MPTFIALVPTLYFLPLLKICLEPDKEDVENLLGRSVVYTRTPGKTIGLCGCNDRAHYHLDLL